MPGVLDCFLLLAVSKYETGQVTEKSVWLLALEAVKYKGTA